MRACIRAEQAGVPSVAIVGRGFGLLAAATAKALGRAGLPIAEFPGVIMTEKDDAFRAKVLDAVLPSVIWGLVDGAGPVAAAADASEPEPGEVVAEGSLDDIQAEFLRRGWSDGLPVIPPTAERVAAFLAHTELEPGHVIGILPPERRAATVHSVAVNGVMAGCRPEYMPVLVAIADILADPRFRLEDAGSTPGWEPLVIVSGPLVKQLDFNSGAGVIRAGRQANTSIGRFTRLFMRNLAGVRIAPEATDKASIGLPTNVALAEDEDAIDELGWPPFRADQGFPAPGTNTVTVQSVVAISAPIYTGGETAAEHLRTLGRLFEATIGPWCFSGILFQSFHPLVVLSPSVSMLLNRQGVGKPELRAYLDEHARIEAGWVERYAYEVGVTNFNLERMVAEGAIPERYFESAARERLIPMCYERDSINFVVAGDPARNQSKVFVNNHEQGPPITREVRLSAR
jgi:hypothetical protein